MSNKLIVIGGGEHSRVVIEAARLSNWRIIGYLDPKENPENEKKGRVKRLGDDTKLPELLIKYPEAKFISGIGGDAQHRAQIIGSLGVPEKSWTTVIHPSATVSPQAEINPGTVIMSRAIVQAGAILGKHSIINSGAIIEHDSRVGEFVHIAPGVVSGGGVKIGRKSFIGLGSRIRDHITIGEGVTVGTGSVVVTDIPDGETVVGSPARRISHDRKTLDISELCISPDATIYECLSTIGKYGTMLALVTDAEHRLLGIITDGDIRRALLRHKDLNESIGTVMNKKFSFVYEDVSRAAALDHMKARTIRQMPVLDRDGRVVGLHLLSELIGSLNLPNIAIVMAGGKGTRLRPITEDIPKPLVKVAGRPILEHIILHLAGFNLREIYLAVNYKSELIEEHFADGSSYGCNIRYLREQKPLGTGGALSLLPTPPSEPFLVMNGDLVTQFDVERMLNCHGQNRADITIGVHDHRVDIPYGVIELDETGKMVTGLLEKPSRHFIINGGIYVVNPEMLKLIKAGEEMTMVDLVERALEKGARVGVHLVEGDWIDVGQHHELAAARGL